MPYLSGYGPWRNSGRRALLHHRLKAWRGIPGQLRLMCRLAWRICEYQFVRAARWGLMRIAKWLPMSLPRCSVWLHPLPISLLSRRMTPLGVRKCRLSRGDNQQWACLAHRRDLRDHRQVSITGAIQWAISRGCRNNRRPIGQSCRQEAQFRLPLRLLLAGRNPTPGLPGGDFSILFVTGSPARLIAEKKDIGD